MKRAEWAAVAALFFSCATAIFTGGVIYGQVQAQGLRISTLERHDESTSNTLTNLQVGVGEIRTSVAFLVARAQADDRRSRRRDLPSSPQ